MVILGLIYVGIWAGGIANQKGLNKYKWTIIPIGIYIIIYAIAYLIMNLGFSLFLSPYEDRFQVLMIVLLIKAAIIILPFFITKLIMDEIYRMLNNNTNL